MNQEIIFLHSLICTRCLRVRRIVNKIQKNHPELDIKKVGSVTKFLKRELRTLPALKVGRTVLYGKEITELRILTELGLE
ncbi:MAG: hypothetical protein ACFFB2_12800 [Promethearchaeota archaeon]